MRNNTRCFLLVAVLIAALIAAGFYYRENEALNASRAQMLSGELHPIATILTENYAIIQELQSEPFTEKDYGILESYLTKIRRDGVSKHADMKQRLDALAENNTAIVTLIKAYAPQAKTLAFDVQADKFRNYASAWRDRWNSVIEVFMAGGNYPSSGVPLPLGFINAVDAEIAAIRP